MYAAVWLESVQVEPVPWDLWAAENMQRQGKHSLTEDRTPSICWWPSQSHHVTEVG